MTGQHSLTYKVGFLAIIAALLVATASIGSRYLQQPAQVSLGPIAAETAPGEVVVHVIGAVRKPGLVKLTSNDRVQDAIRKAGGATDNADLSRLNLAARPTDGSQINIPSKVASVDVPTTSFAPAHPVVESQSFAPPPAADQLSGPISLNSATQAELEALPGVGPVIAQKIIQYRQEHGGFRSVEELLEVKGIGPKKMEAIRPFVGL